MDGITGYKHFAPLGLSDSISLPLSLTKFYTPAEAGQMKMIQELDSVVLAENLPEFGLEKGDIGTVVMIHRGGASYEVEFVTLEGKTTAVTSLLSSQVRPIAKGEIAHARMLTAA